MTNVYNKVTFIVFMSYFILGLCEESNEEPILGVEYMQIFRNMPMLFEYVLDALEQRVEILEKDDVTTFQERSKDFGVNGENKEVKREVDDDCLTNLDGKENLDKISKKDAKRYKNGYKRKRQNYEALDHDHSTEIHEYGRAIKHNNNFANKKSVDDVSELKNKTVKRESSKRKPLEKSFIKSVTEMNHKINNFRKEERNKKKGGVKRNVAQLENDFSGIDWTQFHLSPEEVEEKAIKTEQMMEEYNKNNRKK